MCVGTDGVAFAASDPSYVGVNFADRAYFKAALAGTANAGAAVISKVTNKPVVPVAAPIRSRVPVRAPTSSSLTPGS